MEQAVKTVLFTLQAGRHRVVGFHRSGFKHTRVVVVTCSVKRAAE